MPNYSPELIQTMRAALDEAMTKVPANLATPAVKAHMAEIILKAAAAGQASYEGFLVVASESIQIILSQIF
jgi:7-cyano-7-deazaguanine synthase in queuosine biosynthesis